MIGIYKITNLITNEIYVGQGIECERRFITHCKDYEFDRHPNKKLIQNMKEYGITNFSFQIIELCDRDKLDEREMFWIEYYDSYNNGLNMDKGGKTHIGNSNNKGGYNLNEEAKLKISIAQKKSWTPERKEKWSKSQIGVVRDWSNTDTSKVGKGTLGKHKVWDDKATNKYHYE